MSVVTGVLLHTSCCERVGTLQAVMDWFEPHREEWGWYLLNITDGAGGTKHPQTEILAGGLNWFCAHNLEAFIAFLTDIRWELPDNVVAVFNPEDGPALVWRPRDGKIKIEHWR